MHRLNQVILILLIKSFSHFVFILFLLPYQFSFRAIRRGIHNPSNLICVTCGLGKTTPSNLYLQSCFCMFGVVEMGANWRPTGLIITFLTAFAWESDLREHSVNNHSPLGSARTTQNIHGFNVIMVISFSAIIRLWAANMPAKNPSKYMYFSLINNLLSDMNPLSVISSAR